MTDHSFDGLAFRSGVRAAVPLGAPAIPFGLALGLVITDTPAVSSFTGWASSWVLYAGSAQLVGVQLLGEGAAAALIILSLTMVNARHIVYSAVINKRIGAAPRWFRIVGSYLLIDQVFAIDEMRAPELSTRERMWTIMGAGVWLWVNWQLAVLLGVLGGDLLPDDFPVGFIVAVLFAGLMVLSIRNRPGIVAAVVGGGVAVAARDLPPGMAVVIAIVVGAGAGAVAERRLARRVGT